MNFSIPAKSLLFQQKEDVRRQSPVWTVIKSTRYDESKEGEVCSILIFMSLSKRFQNILNLVS